VPFPVSIKGSINIPREVILDGDPETLKRRAIQALELLTDSVTSDGMMIRSRPHFQDHFWGKIGRGHAMAPFDDIDLEIVQSLSGTNVRYRLSTTFMLRFVSPFAIIVFFAAGWPSIQHPTWELSWIEGAKYAGLAFGWVFGLNYLLGWFRGPRWLRKQLLNPKFESLPIE
jgi:hypothetical protein